MSTDDLRARLTALADEWGTVGCSYGHAAQIRALLAATDPAADEALRVEIDEKLGQQATCKVYRDGRLVFSGRDWSDLAGTAFLGALLTGQRRTWDERHGDPTPTPTPPTASPSDLPVATGDAASEPLCAFCPRIEIEHRDRNGHGFVPRPSPAPVHADDTDTGEVERLSEIFKQAWHKADEQGLEGSRVKHGIRAVLKALGAM